MILPLPFQAFILGSSVLASSLATGPLFSTVDEIPSSYFEQRQVIFGRVDRVVDGDTIRVTSCPGPSLNTCPEFDKNQKISGNTLKIRLYAIDTPELQKKKNGPPSQPFAQEAKSFTSELILQKGVKIKLLNRDQYGRAIAEVFEPATDMDVSATLLQKGYATLYTGKGAEYDGRRELLESLQAQAKSKKVGIWSLGDQVVTPADFKRVQRNAKIQ